MTILFAILEFLVFCTALAMSFLSLVLLGITRELWVSRWVDRGVSFLALCTDLVCWGATVFLWMLFIHLLP